MADSWLTDGNCSECRRRKYCNNRCKKAKERLQRQMFEVVDRHTGIGRIMASINSFGR